MSSKSYGYEEEEEENEEAAVQQEEDEDDEYDDTYWERERLRKEKLAGRLEDMLEDTVFWDRCGPLSMCRRKTGVGGRGEVGASCRVSWLL